jgi:hypothetical protein
MWDVYESHPSMSMMPFLNAHATTCNVVRKPSFSRIVASCRFTVRSERYNLAATIFTLPNLATSSNNSLSVCVRNLSSTKIASGSSLIHSTISIAGSAASRCSRYSLSNGSLDRTATLRRFIVSVFAVRFKHSPHPNPPRGRGGSRGSSPVHGGGWEGGMLKNQRKDAYHLQGDSMPGVDVLRIHLWHQSCKKKNTTLALEIHGICTVNFLAEDWMMRHKHRILQVMSGLAEAVNLLLPTELLPRFLQMISRLAFATVLFYFLPSTSVPNDGISYQYVVYGAAVSSGWDTRSYYTNSYDSILGYQTINDQRWQITPRSLLASHVGIYDADGGCWGGTIDRVFHTQRQFFSYISGNPRMFRAASTAGGSAANIVNAVSHCGPWPVCRAQTIAPMSRRHFVQLHFRLSSPTRVRIVSYAAYAFSFGGYDILSDLSGKRPSSNC